MKYFISCMTAFRIHTKQPCADGDLNPSWRHAAVTVKNTTSTNCTQVFSCENASYQSIRFQICVTLWKETVVVFHTYWCEVDTWLIPHNVPVDLVQLHFQTLGMSPQLGLKEKHTRGEGLAEITDDQEKSPLKASWTARWQANPEL